MKILPAILIPSVIRISTAFNPRPEFYEILRKFYELAHPGDGWKKIIRESKEDGDENAETGKWGVPHSIYVCGVYRYSALIGTGSFLYGKFITTGILTLDIIISVYIIQQQ